MKSRNESKAEDHSAFFDKVVGLRAPSIDDPQFPAYLVLAQIIVAGKAGLTDQDLIDRWVVDFFLERPDRVSQYRPLIERAIGRPVGADEPKAFDMDAIRREQQERNQRRAGAMFD
jgi:hypothetical protein